jgi:hypothetical protein
MSGGKVSVKKLVYALKDIPEVKFRITELAHEVMDGGTVDVNKAFTMQHDLNLAINEVKLYIERVQEIKGKLGRAGSSNNAYMHSEWASDVEDWE